MGAPQSNGGGLVGRYGDVHYGGGEWCGGGIVGEDMCVVERGGVVVVVVGVAHGGGDRDHTGHDHVVQQLEGGDVYDDVVRVVHDEKVGVIVVVVAGGVDGVVVVHDVRGGVLGYVLGGIGGVGLHDVGGGGDQDGVAGHGGVALHVEHQRGACHNGGHRHIWDRWYAAGHGGHEGLDVCSVGRGGVEDVVCGGGGDVAGVVLLGFDEGGDAQGGGDGDLEGQQCGNIWGQHGGQQGVAAGVVGEDQTIAAGVVVVVEDVAGGDHQVADHVGSRTLL